METWEKEGRTRTRLCFILNNNRRSPESSKSEMGTRGCDCEPHSRLRAGY